MRKFFREFKEFISKGNVFDMAVGLIIATAFNKIVSSMVNDIIMPLVTWATGANSLADLSIVLKETIKDGETVLLTWNYGNFLQAVIDFLIIALSVFVMVKIVNASRKRLLDAASGAKSKSELRAEKKEVKAKAKSEGRDFDEVWAEYVAEKQAKLEAEEKAKAEAEAKQKLENPSEAELLKEIRDLLKAQKSTKNTKK